jgi:uncharacterized protein YndB with AHSA1/START domain/ketosteroid isomerase-like protein
MSNGTFSTSVRIAAPPADVFPYLTEASLIVHWMGQWAELEAEPGGRLAIDINGVPIRGEYVVVDPPRRVVFTWGAAGHDVLTPGSTTVEILLHADGDGTLLELAHRDLPPEELPRHDVGWGHFLARLEVAAAGGDAGADHWAEATAVTLAFNDAINARDIESLAALMSGTHRFIDSTGATIEGKAACLAAWRGFFDAFPDYRNVFDDVTEVAPGTVLAQGRSECSVAELDGPAMWRAVVRRGRVDEWCVSDPDVSG